MRKFIFSAIVLAASVSFVNAEVTNTEVESVVVETVSEDCYKEVSLSDVNEKVVGALKSIAGDKYEISKVEFCSNDGLVRATLVNADNNETLIVVLNQEGEEVK